MRNYGENMENDLTQERQPMESSKKQVENKVVAPRNQLRLVRSSYKKRLILSELRRSPRSPSVLAGEIIDFQRKPVMSNRHIWFHLRQLRELGLVQSEEGIYSLTLEGMRFCDKEL